MLKRTGAETTLFSLSSSRLIAVECSSGAAPRNPVKNINQHETQSKLFEIN
jgi:hypothetical protein